ncbi:TPA: hypothetical protein NJY08_005112, partial [Salmonella enterica subsp. enterica serovar Typhi str. AG3]|nr:hypothetical protein [Salmonella enterica subsp. enterica serovar Typhi str. AG3]
QPNRIEVLENQLALLDDEIAFAYEIRGTKMMVTTFFGRVSVNPSLGNVDVLRRYNKHFNEQIHLAIPKEKLELFEFPTAPKAAIEFSITSNVYRMYFYQNNQDQNMYYLIHYLNQETNKWEHTLIDLQHVNRTKVNETELYILAMLGHAEFVYNYLKLYEKERFQNLYNIYSKRAIHKYVGFKYKR